MDIEDVLSVPNSNPNLQPKIREAREMFKFAAIFFLIAALIYVLWGVIEILRGLFLSPYWGTFWWGRYYPGISIFFGIVRIILAGVAIIIKVKFVENVITPIDEGRYQESEDDMVVYMIFGFIFGLILSGVLILLGYMKFEEIDLEAKNCPTCRSSLRYVQQYDNWYCDNCVDYKVPVHAAKPSTTPPPPQSQQQSQQPPPPGQPQQQKQQEPQQPQQQPAPPQQQPPPPPQQEQGNQCSNCGGQMRYIDENDRWYCDSCQEYK